MKSPYRGESNAIREELRASLRRITPELEALLPESLRARLLEARAIVHTPVPLAAHLDAAHEAIAMAPDIERRLAELSNELPPLPDASGEPVNEALLRACLPGRVTDVQVGEIGAVDLVADDRDLHRGSRGLPAFDLYTQGISLEPLTVRGAPDAVTNEVRAAARALGTNVFARVTVAAGLASVVWSGPIDATRPHERAILLLTALREVRAPRVALLR